MKFKIEDYEVTNKEILGDDPKFIANALSAEISVTKEISLEGVLRPDLKIFFWIDGEDTPRKSTLISYDKLFIIFKNKYYNLPDKDISGFLNYFYQVLLFNNYHKLSYIQYILNLWNIKLL